MYIYDSNGNGLMNLIGGAAGAMNLLNTVRRTTIPDRINSFAGQYKNVDLESLSIGGALEGLQSATNGWISGGSTISSQLRNVVESTLVAWAAEEASLVDASVTTALQYLIQAMHAGYVYVTPCGVTTTVVPDADNIGDVVLVVTARQGDGRACEFAISETLTATLTTESSTAPTIGVVGNAAAYDRMGPSWPEGSGASISLTATTASASLLPTGGFLSWTNNTPTGWLTTANNVMPSAVSGQTVTIYNSPTGGRYYLIYTDPYGTKRSTTALAFNATASQVQTALRALPGLSAVTVTSTGSVAEYIFQLMVNFVAVPGTVPLLEIVENLDRGGIEALEMQPGDAGSYTGHSLRIDGPLGGFNTTMYAPLTGIRAGVVYLCHFWLTKTSNPEDSNSTSQSGTSSSSTATSSSTELSLTTTSGSSSSSSTLYEFSQPQQPPAPGPPAPESEPASYSSSTWSSWSSSSSSSSSTSISSQSTPSSLSTTSGSSASTTSVSSSSSSSLSTTSASSTSSSESSWSRSSSSSLSSSSSSSPSRSTEILYSSSSPSTSSSTSLSTSSSVVGSSSTTSASSLSSSSTSSESSSTSTSTSESTLTSISTQSYSSWSTTSVSTTSASSSSSTSLSTTSLSTSSVNSSSSTSTTSRSSYSSGSSSSSSTSISTSSVNSSSSTEASETSSSSPTTDSSSSQVSDGCQGITMQWQWNGTYWDSMSSCPAGCSANPPDTGGEWLYENRYTACVASYQGLPPARQPDAIDRRFEELREREVMIFGVGDSITTTSISSASSSSESTRSSASSSSTTTQSSSSTSASSTLSMSTSSSPSSSSSFSSSVSTTSASTSTAALESSSSESSQYTQDLRMEIVDGYTGTILHDDFGGENAFRVNVADVQSTAQDFSFSFRLPATVQQPAYLRIRMAGSVPWGYSLFIDELAIQQGTQLYTGGPYAAAFTGRRTGVVGDTWQIQVENDRRGQVQEWFHRFFDMAGKGLLLPVTGQNPVPESVIVGLQTPEG